MIRKWMGDCVEEGEEPAGGGEALQQTVGGGTNEKKA